MGRHYENNMLSSPKNVSIYLKIHFTIPRNEEWLQYFITKKKNKTKQKKTTLSSLVEISLLLHLALLI